MDQIASQTVGHVVNILTGHITKHLRYVTSSTKYVADLRKKMEVLGGKIDDVKRHVQRNKEDSKEIPARVEGWLRDVENVKNEVKSISSNGIGCLYMKRRYQVGRKAFKTINEIERLINEKIEWSDASIPFGRVHFESTPTFTPSQSCEIFTQNGFQSRNEKFKEALKFLQQNENASQVIALCGMGGVGKTTLMEKLETFARDNKTFHWIAKVVFSQNWDILSIQKDIAVYIGVKDLPEASESVRADHLYKKFIKLSEAKEKTLVILDDVWEKIKLKDIGLRSPLPNGVKLLLTSRDSNVCTQIAADVHSDLQVVKVDVLEEAEAIKFFCEITGVSEEGDLEKHQIGCNIVKKCGRLPLAIKIIASSLKSRDVSVWENALNRLNKNDLHKNVQEVIHVSYEHIEEDEDRKVFLHCGLFPEDFDIPIEDLTRHAWGLKMLENVSTLREARARTTTCVENLKNANLLIDSDHAGCVKMHDLVHAFVLGRVSKGDIAWIVNHGDVSNWDTNEPGKPCKIISLTCRGLPEFHRDFKYPNLSLLQLMHGGMSLTFPEDFYENKEKLQVIAFYKMQHPRLPTSLANLRSLCLHECKLMFDCSFIGDLVNLEVLSFASCGIHKLPSTIGKLRNLKLLDLTGCVDLLIDDGVFKNLKNLEELYMSVSSQRAIRFTDANFEELTMLSEKLCVLEVEFIDKKAPLKNLPFKNLYKFKIAIGCMLMPNEIYSFKNTLKLVSNRRSDLLDCKVDELFKKTENLHLQVKDMTGLVDVISIHRYDLRKHLFYNLRDLEVSECVNLKYLFPFCVASGLRKLERLTVFSCSVLEALIHNDGSEINSGGGTVKFEELKFLSLRDLPKLECLFAFPNVAELPQLSELEVDGLPNFTSIYPDSNNISPFQRPLLNFQDSGVLKLKKLNVKSMDELNQIWACSSEEKVSNTSFMLREIEVEKCDNLVNLFPINPMSLLNHLEKLTVKACGLIETIFNIDLGCVGGVKQVSKGRLKRIDLRDLEKLREVWRIKSNENNSSLFICGFEAIESIGIDRCKRFSNVFTSIDTKFDIRIPADIISNDRRERRGDKELINFGTSKEIPEVVAFPSYLIPAFPHHLSELFLGHSERLEVVFEIIINGESPATHDTQQQILLFPFLKLLVLGHMERMTHVWKCDNWNKFLILQKKHPQSSPFHNLTTISMWSCHSIKYLFSPLMAKLLSNLEMIIISHCEGIEEVVSSRDDKHEEIHTHIPTGFFHCLDSLNFDHLKELKRIGGGEFKLSQVSAASWSICQYSRRIYIENCQTLSSVVPFYAVGQMHNLQALKVSRCESLTEVFETQGINNNNKGGGSTNIDEGNDVANTTIPRLENTNVPKLSNLKELIIIGCNLLQLVFTYSTLESLKQLEELRIQNCEAMKVIVKNDIGELRKEVDFPRLKSLTLSDLPNLEGFFLGKNDFQWPVLEKCKIDSCPKMMVFTFGQSTAPKLEYMHTSLGKHNLGCGLNFHATRNETRLSSSESTTSEQLPAWSFHNLIEISMDWNSDVKCIIPSKELLQLQNLERIRLHGSSVGGIFDESETVVEIPHLKQVELSRLFRLKYICKSNHAGRTPLKFPNLTTLSVILCHSLKNVLTTSMVGSLLHLEDIHICNCPSLEVIVKEEESEEEIECVAKVKKIVMLPCLKSLKLTQLKSLRGFCLGKDDFTFPSLNTLQIKNCPSITVFTNGRLDTPVLNVIDTNFGRCYIEEDLNSFIKTKQNEGFQF